MLYILSGQDDFSLVQSLDEIKKEIGEPETVALSTTTLEGQQVTRDQLKIVCEAAPFLLGRRLVIVKGLLERFESRGRTSRRQRTISSPSLSRSQYVLSSVSQPPEAYKSLASYITQIPDSTILVLVENNVASNNLLFQELAPKAVMKTFPLLREARLRQWIQQRVAEEGGSIAARAVDLLAKLVGSNLWVMSGEIAKLVVFTSGRRIEEEDVGAVVSDTQQASVFAMVDAIVDFKSELAEKLLQQLFQQGAAPAYLLSMLARQVRMIVRTRELKNQGKTRAEIQSKLGLTSEFALRKTIEQAAHYSLPRLKEVYQQLLAADLWIKTGKYEAELALNILVAELCQQGRVYSTSPESRLK